MFGLKIILSNKGRTTVTSIRSWLGIIWIYFWIGFGVIITCILGWLVPQKWVICFWNKCMLPVALWGLKVFGGIGIEVRGQQYINQDKAIYACKHESALETYTMTSIITRGVMILKKELTYIPLFGWAQWLYGLIPVDRGAGAKAMKKMLAAAQKRVDQNRPIIIFPEGHRMKPGTTQKYKPGFLFLAQNLNLPIIPVALNTGMFWPRSSTHHLQGKVIIEFMEPMTAGKDKNAFIEELQKRIEQKCDELNQETVKNYPATAINLAKK